MAKLAKSNLGLALFGIVLDSCLGWKTWGKIGMVGNWNRVSTRAETAGTLEKDDRGKGIGG